MRKMLLLPLVCLCWSWHAHAADKEKMDPQDPPDTEYFKFSDPLVTNLKDGDSYIRCEVQLMFHPSGESDDQQLLDLYAPAMRHTLLVLLVDQTSKALLKPTGKKRLRKAAVKALRKVMQKQTGRPVVEDLYFTTYYVR
jgi:flagellar FliL protein